MKDTECMQVAGRPRTCSLARGAPRAHAWGGMRAFQRAGPSACKDGDWAPSVATRGQERASAACSPGHVSPPAGPAGTWQLRGGLGRGGVEARRRGTCSTLLWLVLKQ